MLVNQIAVFLENKAGRLDALVKAISAANVNLESLNIADTRDFGIVRIITDDNRRALEVIKEAGFTAATVDLVGVSVKNRPGTLSLVLDALAQENVSIEYIYSFAQSNETNLILFKADDAEAAQKALIKHNI